MQNKLKRLIFFFEGIGNRFRENSFPLFIIHCLNYASLRSSLVNALLRQCIKNQKVIKHLAWFAAKEIEWHQNTPQNPTILCIKRLLFYKDIQQLKLRTHMNWPCVDNETVIAFFYINTVPPYMRKQTYHIVYNDNKSLEVRERCLLFAKTLLIEALKTNKIDAVLSANIDYWNEIGFPEACKELSIPFLVLSKEYPIIGYAQKQFIERYKYTFAQVSHDTEEQKHTGYEFKGDGIAIAGRSMKDLIVECGMYGEDKVWVTGFPRMDVWRDKTESDLAKDTVTLLSYAGENYHGAEHFQETLYQFTQTAIANQDHGIRFVVKCKSKDDYRSIRCMLDKKSLTVLTLDYKIGFHELFSRSLLVIGFNSFSLLEALLSDTLVAIPNWGECKRSSDELQMTPEDPKTKKVIHFLENQEELDTLLLDVINNPKKPENMKDRLDLVKEKCYFPEEVSCSNEVEKFINHFVEK